MTSCGRVISQIVQYDLQCPDAVPPVDLRLVDMPRLRTPGVHESMAPLPEMVEELVCLANDLSEETSLVCVRGQLLDLDTRDRVSGHSRSPREIGHSR